MQALEELAATPDGVSLARLSERLRTPKTSLLSLLRTLESNEYVVYANGAYCIGPRTRRLAALLSSAMSFSATVRPFLLDLVERCEETALTGVLADDRRHAIYTDIVDGRGAIRFHALVGTRRPLYCSAVGKVLLAFQDDGFIDAYLSTTELVIPTTGIRLEKQAAIRRLEEIRMRGVSVSFEEIVEGAGGFAAPIFGRDGQMAAAVVIAAPIGRATRRYGELFGLIHDSGERMSRVLGFQGPYPGK